MKAKELADLLMTTPDYEVKIRTHKRTTWDDPFPKHTDYDVDDVGYADEQKKMIILEVL